MHFAKPLAATAGFAIVMAAGPSASRASNWIDQIFKCDTKFDTEWCTDEAPDGSKRLTVSDRKTGKLICWSVEKPQGIIGTCPVTPTRFAPQPTNQPKK